MTYISTEASVDDGNPIELYEFVGTYKTYRMTSYHESVVYDSNSYTAIPIRRRNVKASVQDEKEELKIELPVDEDLVTDYGVQAPPQDLELTIYRQHGLSGQTVVFFKGTVTAITIEGTNRAIITVPSVFTVALQGELPNVFFQAQCNHVLYDTRCTVNPASFTVNSTITGINSTEIIVSTVGSQGGTSLVAGRIIVGSEERMVTAQSGTLLTILFPFTTNVQVGDSCTLLAGCDHTVHTCRDKFNNVINFGGMPFVPGFNPFQGNIV